ncbi:MAG: hypothetical protein WCE81_03300 [Halobacteriota archaeon]
MNKCIALLFISIIVLASVFISGCTLQSNQKPPSAAAYKHLVKINEDHRDYYDASYHSTDNLVSSENDVARYAG